MTLKPSQVFLLWKMAKLTKISFARNFTNSFTNVKSEYNLLIKKKKSELTVFHFETLQRRKQIIISDFVWLIYFLTQNLSKEQIYQGFIFFINYLYISLFVGPAKAKTEFLSLVTRICHRSLLWTGERTLMIQKVFLLQMSPLPFMPSLFLLAAMLI